MAIADRLEIADQRLVVLGIDLRAGRHFQRHVAAIGAMAVATHAVTAGLGLEMLLVAIIDQRVEAGDRLHPDIAAAAAVAAVRSAEFDKFLAAEGDAAGTAIARSDIDLGLVEEFHRFSSFVFRSAEDFPCAVSIRHAIT